MTKPHLPESSNALTQEMKTIYIILLTAMAASCSTPAFRKGWTHGTAPPRFLARFETSKGDFEVTVEREWSPGAADRFHQLLKHHAFDHSFFYRIVPDFVAQFGDIDSTRTLKWDQFKVSDEPVIKGNIKGRLSFARSGKDSRSTQLFINLKDNSRLDTIFYNETKGFPAFGEVTKGMAVVEALYGGYGNSTMTKIDSIGTDRKKILTLFPRLDSIRKAYILSRNGM